MCKLQANTSGKSLTENYANPPKKGRELGEPGGPQRHVLSQGLAKDNEGLLLLSEIAFLP